MKPEMIPRSFPPPVDTHCETCACRNAQGYCTSAKLDEDGYFEDESDREDMLIYDYMEGGGFWVGPRFGCVHHVPRLTEEEPS